MEVNVMSFIQGMHFLIGISFCVAPFIFLYVMSYFQSIQEQQWIMEERMHIMELMIKQSDDEYSADPRGIRWGYHHIDSEGNIIRKR